MAVIKKFFKIESPYKFEMNDLRALIQVVNVLLIMRFGLCISWFGLALAVFGLIKDLTIDRHINGIVMHLAGIALNIYFLTILYKQCLTNNKKYVIIKISNKTKGGYEMEERIKVLFKDPEDGVIFFISITPDQLRLLQWLIDNGIIEYTESELTTLSDAKFEEI